MKRTLLTLALLAATGVVHAAPWTYKGTLNDGGMPANGQYDLRVTLLNEAKTTNVTSPVTFYAVNVVEGNFSVDVDFGIDLSTAPVMALETEVQQGGSGFVALGEPTRFDPKSALAGVCWDTSGNAGTIDGDFIGTSDNQPLSIRANNASAIRIIPSLELDSGRPITHNIIAGSKANGVIAPARGGTIAGGGAVNNKDPDYTVDGSNRVDDNYGTIGGGFDNQAGSDSATVTDGAFATVGGGRHNSATGGGSTVSGGNDNIASSGSSTVGGGSQNIASGGVSTVSGGLSNQATGSVSNVSGGTLNVAGGTNSTVGGGLSNEAAGGNSMVGGGANNCAGGDYSWVGGQGAKTRVGNGAGDGSCAPSSADADGDEGSFVWADKSSNTDFVSAQPNQFIVRAANGVGINTNLIGGSTEMVIQSLDGGSTLQLRTLSDKSGSLSVSDTTGTLSFITAPTTGANRIVVLGGAGGTASLSNGGTWTNASSRSYKENFSAVNAADVLSRLVALPIMTWDYIGSAEGLHMGPVAEDFKESFGLAGDGKSISTVDADGIALAAIQGLNAKLETENEALRARLDALEARFQ